MNFSTEYLNRVRQANSLAEIVKEAVKLKRSGQNLVGLCPFHEEKAPTFNVNPEKQNFYCFGCQKRGDVFDFVIAFYKLNFHAAVEFLIKRSGIPGPGLENLETSSEITSRTIESKCAHEDDLSLAEGDDGGSWSEAPPSQPSDKKPEMPQSPLSVFYGQLKLTQKDGDELFSRRSLTTLTQEALAFRSNVAHNKDFLLALAEKFSPCELIEAGLWKAPNGKGE